MQEIRNRRIALILVILMTVLFIPTASYAADEADDIKYSADSGEEVDFDEDDFNEVCEDLTGEELDYVKFDLPSSSKGILYYDYDGSNEEEVDDSDKYYYDKASSSIDDITFVPDEDYSGTVTISYEGTDEDDNDFTGEIKITVDDDGEDADEITYSVNSDESVEFDNDDFEDVCQDVNDEDLDYVKFTLPSSSRGILYYNYDDGEYDSKVSATTAYYSTTSPAISKVTFVPDEDYSGAVTIKYKGYDEDGDTFSGTVKITVAEGDSESGDIKYTVDADDEINFDEDDFNDFCEDENDESLDYVTFTLPSSSKGIIYYDYDGDDEAKITSSTKYYYDKNPSIDDLTFVPDDDYSGSCKIKFEGYDQDGDSIKGYVVISVDNEDMVADTIYLSGIAGNAVAMFDEYFNKECKELLDNTLDYVKFTLPASTSGTLYYDYSSGSTSAKVSASTKYYYDDKSPYLSKVSFVSAGSSAGTYTIKYTGYDEDGSTFTGEVKITASAGTGTTGTSSQFFTDVSGDYSWAVRYVDTLYSTSVIPSDMLTSTTKYNPGTKITRGDFMLLLCRALNLSSATATTNFSDVAQGSYYYDAIATAKSLGIAQGSNNKFYPTTTITREDAMALALRAMNISGNSVGAGNISDLNSYSDNSSVSSYAKEAMAALIKAGIVTGSTDGKLYPKNNITRAESAAVIYRIKY